MFTDGRDNGVHMIRHHDKFAKLVTFSVKMSQTGFHDSLAIWACQDAASITSPEPPIYRLGEALVKFILLARVVRLWIQFYPERFLPP